ncbi:MAG: glycosyltransferase [Planctomycetota bacterium]
MTATVIISTYKNPVALRRCLLGFAVQTRTDFDVFVIDDGSGPETKDVLEDPQLCSLNMRYLWHADKGFRKNLLLNRAIALCESDYLIFCDGDCIPRDDFVANHLRFARPQHYVSGTRVEVPETTHRHFSDHDICSGRVFDPDYLCRQDRCLSRFRWRMGRHPWQMKVGDLLTTRFFVFHGSNAGAWREDLLRINGFDEQLTWGSDDRDVGARLKNVGVGSVFKKFSLVQLHLGHGRGWADPVRSAQNRATFKARLWMMDRTVRANPGVATALDRSDGYELQTIAGNEFAA